MVAKKRVKVRALKDTKENKDIWENVERCETWMKYHTVADLRDLAQEMADIGEDVSPVVELITELDHLLYEDDIVVGNLMDSYNNYNLTTESEEAVL